MMGWGYGFGGFGMFFMLFFWIGIIALVFWFISRAMAGSSNQTASNSGGSISAQESPLDILRRRYASGEISKEEFDAMQRDLTGR